MAEPRGVSRSLVDAERRSSCGIGWERGRSLGPIGPGRRGRRCCWRRCRRSCRPSGAAAQTFTVNSAGDPGTGVCDGTECTLREAIVAANANAGADTIAFEIPGAGVQTIAPTAALPDITDSVTIDGYTQDGASENTAEKGTNAVLLIELSGASAPFNTPGLRVTGGSATIRGLVINRLQQPGHRRHLSRRRHERQRRRGQFPRHRPDGNARSGQRLRGERRRPEQPRRRANRRVPQPHLGQRHTGSGSSPPTPRSRTI